MGRKKKIVAQDGTETETDSTSSLVVITTSLGEVIYRGVIELVDNTVVDFRPYVQDEECALKIPTINAVDFRKLILQKKENDFRHIHEWSDGWLCDDDLKPYRKDIPESEA